MLRHFVATAISAATALGLWSPPVEASPGLHVGGPISPELRVEGRYFKDAAGRVVILRGVNMAGNSKVPPFTPIDDASLFDPLQRSGMNVVRLLFTWEAYEPQPGAYNQAYLDYITNAVHWAWARDIYVIIDFHQDAFSRFSIGGCGEGFPAWTLPPSLKPAVPNNGAGCANWGLQMVLDLDVKAAWESFHTDSTGARTRYIAMVQSVARHLADEPGVIGYDMMNEPWGDEPTQIRALYEDVAVAIRNESPTAIMFVTPHALVGSGSQTAMVRPTFGNFAYSPHYYDASVLVFKNWPGVEPEGPFGNMIGKAREWEVPLFVGELGGPADASRVLDYMDAMYRRLDEGFHSAAQWVYTPGWTEEAKDGWNAEDLSIVDDEGSHRANFRIRPFARKIAGLPVSFREARETVRLNNRVELAWEHDPSTGETEVFVPAEEVFGTTDVIVETREEDLSCSFGSSLVKCTSPVAGTKSIRIRARAGQLPAGEPRCGLTGVEMMLLLPLLRIRRRRRG